ncbi:MAG: protoheme IX farnesyltransferase [Pseudomonadota bacterium]|nr:MAG: protoheme IX farnesyltransferase [Pseudomonadota bacterium]
MKDTVKLLYSVAKLRIGFAIMLSALAGLAVAPGVKPGGWQIFALALAVLLSSGAAGAFNQFAERDLDARMARTRSRPFVTGRFMASSYWLAAIGMVLAAAVAGAALATNLTAALYVFLGAFTYGVVYTVWLKRRTSLNIVIGGLAGSFAVLAGAAAVNPSIATAPLILAVVLFLWTPPHFWSLAWVYRDDYAQAGVPMLPVVASEATTARIIFAHTLLLVTLSLLPAAFGMGWIYLLGAASGGAYFLVMSWRLLRAPSRAAAGANFRASLVQLSLLLLAAILDAAVLGS